MSVVTLKRTPKKKTNLLVQPFLKWAGGKRQLLKEIKKYIPKNIGTYYEPFLGGGALLFNLQPSKAIVNDSNKQLIEVYEAIRDDINNLIKELAIHQNDEEHFYEVRELDRKPCFSELSKVRRAARIIYLNKTCYNGLFRVNSQGQFNVPFGKYRKPQIVNEIVLRAVNKYLNDIDIKFTSIDFEDALKTASKKSFVYLDPPYDPVSDTSSFTGYTLERFDKEEQKRLKDVCDSLNNNGCKFLLSNSDTPFIRDLYKKYKIETVYVGRVINSIASKRGKIAEVLVRNYDTE